MNFANSGASSETPIGRQRVAGESAKLFFALSCGTLAAHGNS
jgi:hypothetical protein